MSGVTGAVVDGEAAAVFADWMRECRETTADIAAHACPSCRRGLPGINYEVWDSFEAFRVSIGLALTCPRAAAP